MTTQKKQPVPGPEQFLAAYAEPVQRTAQAARALVMATLPALAEAVYPGWKLIGYRLLDGKRTRYFCFVAPQADHVRLGFEYGVLLEDPSGLLEGSGTRVRYVTLRRPEQTANPDLAELIIQAAEVAAAGPSQLRRDPSRGR